jgi:hypothetical protein
LDATVKNATTIHYVQDGVDSQVDFMNSCYVGAMGSVTRRDYGHCGTN